MYAVIECGGKQQRVAEGDVLDVELLNVPEEETVQIDKVLLVGEGADVKIGTPYVEGAKVSLKVIDRLRGEKIKIVKFRRRKHYQKVTGHRQWYNRVQVTAITA